MSLFLLSMLEIVAQCCCYLTSQPKWGGDVVTFLLCLLIKELYKFPYKVVLTCVRVTVTMCVWLSHSINARRWVHDLHSHIYIGKIQVISTTVNVVCVCQVTWNATSRKGYSGKSGWGIEMKLKIKINEHSLFWPLFILISQLSFPHSLLSFQCPSAQNSGSIIFFLTKIKWLCSACLKLGKVTYYSLISSD